MLASVAAQSRRARDATWAQELLESGLSRAAVDAIPGYQPPRQLHSRVPRLQDGVRRRLGAWRRIGAPSHVLRWLREGVRVEWENGPPKPFHHGVGSFTPAERTWLTAERDRCLGTGAWRRATCFDFVSRAFIVTNKGKRRLVVDLRHVNEHHLKRSCRFETLQKLRRMARRGDYMWSIDLSDAYHHVGMHEDDQDYFTFAIQTEDGTEYFSTSALNFGWTMSPWYFTQVMKPVVAYMRNPSAAARTPSFGQRVRTPPGTGVRTLPWLDDFAFFHQAESQEEACVARDFTFSVLEELGLKRNETKGQPEPSHVLRDHLGYCIDSVRGLFLLTVKRELKLRAQATDLLCRAARHRRLIPRRDLASFAGLAQSSVLAVPLGRCWLRSLYDDVGGYEQSLSATPMELLGGFASQLFQDHPSGPREAYEDARFGRQMSSRRHWWSGLVRLSSQTISDLRRWTRLRDSRWVGRSIWLEPESRVLHADAGPYGWGAQLDYQRHELPAHGFWTPDEAEWHIGMRELRAVRLAVTLWIERLRGRRVLLYEDNQSVVAILTTLTSRSPQLMHEVRLLAEILDKHEIHLRAIYIRSADNVVADFFSRLAAPHDYRIAEARFESVQAMWGRCTVDAFASGATARLQRWWAERPTHGAEAVDAFAQEWRGERAWAHPPPFLLPQLAQLLRERPDAEALVCAPYWPGEAWYADLLELSSEHISFPAGSLQRVAADAPARLETWPVTVFRVPLRA